MAGLSSRQPGESVFHHANRSLRVPVQRQGVSVDDRTVALPHFELMPAGKVDGLGAQSKRLVHAAIEGSDDRRICERVAEGVHMS